MWIQIFRSGEHTDSKGNKNAYSNESLDKIAGLYNAKVKDSSSNEAPLVKGHPATDAPAYGWIERLKRRGDLLLAKLKELSPSIIDDVKKGLFKKVSIALYPDLMLRHVGLLGAAAPAVKGLKNVKFNSGDDFSEYELSRDLKTSNFSIEQFVIEENNELKSKIEQLERELREKDFREYANSLIENSDGLIITPAQADSLVEILETAFRHDEDKQFNDCIIDKIKNFISGLKPVFSLDELGDDLPDGNSFDDGFDDLNVDSDKLDLHKRARQLQAQTPGLTYEDAVLKLQYIL